MSVGEFYNKMMTYMELNFASITYHHLSGLQVNSNQEKKVVILQKLGNDPVYWNSFLYLVLKVEEFKKEIDFPKEVDMDNSG